MYIYKAVNICIYVHIYVLLTKVGIAPYWVDQHARNEQNEQIFYPLYCRCMSQRFFTLNH